MENHNRVCLDMDRIFAAKKTDENEVQVLSLNVEIRQFWGYLFQLLYAKELNLQAVKGMKELHQEVI